MLGFKHYGFYRNGYGNNYYIGHKRQTWTQANQYCRRLWGGKGRLARIDNLRENNWLYSVVGRQNAWIGANDRAREGRWTWSDSCRFKYTRWNTREPNNYRNEDCGHLIKNGGGKWNDIKCSNRFSFICKKIRPNYVCGEY